MSSVVDKIWRNALGTSPDATQWTERLSLADGEAAQLEVLGRWQAHGEALGGWKVGLTSGRSRDAFGAGFRPFGYILASRILPSGAALERVRIRGCGVENEVCFLIGRDLAGASVDARAARAAVHSIAPAFEINETRLPGNADNGLRIADDLSQWGIVVGEKVALRSSIGETIDLDRLTVELARDGEPIERVAAPGHIDDHFASIAALTRELAKFGRGLHAGDHVITGAFTRQAVAAPARFEGRFGALGSVSVSFV